MSIPTVTPAQTAVSGSDLTTAVTTAAITVIVGVVVYALSQIITKFVINPIQNQDRLRGKIAYYLSYYANAYCNPIMDSRHKKAATKFRELACQLESSTKLIRQYGLYSFLRLVPPIDDIKKASTKLTFLSIFTNMPIPRADPVENLGASDEIKRLLRLVLKKEEKQSISSPH